MVEFIYEKDMKKLFLASILILFIIGCEKFEPIERIFLISDSQQTSSRKAFDGCVIKYSLANYYTNRTEEIQKQAVNKAFGLWQKTNPNVLFTNVLDTSSAEIIIKFVSSKNIIKGEKYVPYGIMKTALKSISSLKLVKGFKYELLLDNTYNWDETSITRVVAFNIGSYLGLGISEKTNSVMNPIASNIALVLSKEDSTLYYEYYKLPCKDTKTESLPIKLKLSCDLITKEFLTGKAGTISIKSSGILTVGQFLGDSTPEGKDTFIGGLIPIDKQYYLEPKYPHGSVMYKLTNDKEWLSCKSNCEFTTKGNEYVKVSLLVNQIKAYANIGAYDVVINYK